MTKKRERAARDLAVLGPFVLATDLILLLGSEVVLDVEGLADLLWGLALDHVRDSLAADIEKLLDVEVVGSEDNFEEHFLVDSHEFLVPILDVGRLLARIGLVIGSSRRIGLVMLAPLENLLEDGFIDIRDGDGLSSRSLGQIFEQVLDEDAALSNLALNLELSTVGAMEGEKLRHLDDEELVLAVDEGGVQSWMSTGEKGECL